MYLHKPTYDPDELFSANYHIHTNLSRCGKKEMVLADIVRSAEKAGLREIAITDHIHPFETPKINRNLRRLTPQVQQIDSDIKIYLGAELSAHGENKYTLKYSGQRLDYHLYSHNHYHMRGWEQPQNRTPEGYKEHCKKTLYNIINSGKADCLAHPFTDKYIVREFEDEYAFTYGCITNLWTDNEIGDIMQAAKEKEVAWEINTSILMQYKDFMKRYFHIGKEVGVCFNLGTDAHTLQNIDPSPLKEFFIKEIM
ncbi:MAG: PHP domain-containing protein [Oscillospiraceae bacterium]|nr:PHP domain-containing protein [Oscillospiraceae bacterium]